MRGGREAGSELTAVTGQGSQQPSTGVDLQLLDVGELHVQAVGAAPAVAEVHLPEGLARELAQLPLAGTDDLGVEQAGRVLRGQGEGEVPAAAVKPKPARTPAPVLVAACLRVSARTRGCQRWRTASASRWARSGRGWRIWSLTYRSTVRCEMPSTGSPDTHLVLLARGTAGAELTGAPGRKGYSVTSITTDLLSLGSVRAAAGISIGEGAFWLG